MGASVGYTNLLFSLCSPVFRRSIVVCIKCEDNGVDKEDRTGSTHTIHVA
jgi:hypothetical protein